MPVKFQPSPKREADYFTKIIRTTEPSNAMPAPELEVIFGGPSPPTVMKNPIASTAARMMERISIDETLALAEASTEKKRLEPTLPEDFPHLPDNPTPDTVLEWLGAARRLRPQL